MKRNLRVSIVLTIVMIVSLMFAGCVSEEITETPQVTLASPTPMPPMETLVLTAMPEPTATAFLPNPPTATPEPYEGEYVTFVLMGFDNDSLGWGVRTDIFVIITTYFGKDGTQTFVVSVPRDLYIEVKDSDSGWTEDRINAAYERGGFEGVRETVERNFGLEVNAGVYTIFPLDFIELVDQMGGVIVTANRDYSFLCPRYDRDAKFGFIIKSGESSIFDGEQALCYVRSRGFGDVDRLHRTSDFIRGLTYSYIPNFWEEPDQAIVTLKMALNLIKTDLSSGDILKMASQMIRVRRNVFTVQYADWVMGKDIEFHVTEKGASVIKPLVDLKTWIRDKLPPW